ncbi:N-acetylmuramoyl-L-alanine amidase [Latilactobacillus curvatus]|uniref:N-acetylmuramoyl-L-alanine amidase n=1 Tax=Latilactobacillus curvatus TaxID=28038 RepID=UPI00345E5819
MIKLNKLVVAFGAAILVATTMSGAVSAYSIDTTHQLGANEGSSQPTINGKIVIHSTDNMDAQAVNNAIFEKRTWLANAAYVHYIVGDNGKVFQVGQPGYVAWGAGANINYQAPVQIELAETSNHEQFKTDYATLIELVANSARTYGINRVLNPAYGLNGVVTHNYVSQVYGGTDHTDPTGYLAKHGVSTEQLAQDVANGYSSLGAGQPSTTTPTNPTTPSAQNEWAENWHFKNGNQPIQARLGTPSLSAPYAGKLPAWTTIYYDRVAVRDGYVWCHWTTNNGDSVWMPVHPVGTANNVWVSFD